MAETSTIEWTDATWNPITGCSVISPGCANCYAMKLAGGRMKNHPSRQGLTRPSKAGPVWTGEVRFNEDWLEEPLRWTRPRRIFVCAHGDLFHESVPDEWIDRVFAVMALASHHTFQVLTKRPERMRRYFAGIPELPNEPAARDAMIEGEAQALEHRRTGRDPSLWLAVHMPLPNVWLGVSAEDQERADQRLPHLLATPATVRFLSGEPLLTGLDIGWALTRNWAQMGNGFLRRGHFSPGGETLRPLNWVIVGGESGRGGRPINPLWVRSIRDQCLRAGTPFFFKQWGEWWPQECHPVGSFPKVLKIAGLEPTPALVRGCWGADGVWRPGGIAGGPPAYTSWRVGKKAAGRLLDGVEHNGVPEVSRD